MSAAITFLSEINFPGETDTLDLIKQANKKLYMNTIWSIPQKPLTVKSQESQFPLDPNGCSLEIID